MRDTVDANKKKTISAKCEEPNPSVSEQVPKANYIEYEDEFDTSDEEASIIFIYS